MPKTVYSDRDRLTSKELAKYKENMAQLQSARVELKAALGKIDYIRVFTEPRSGGGLRSKFWGMNQDIASDVADILQEELPESLVRVETNVSGPRDVSVTVNMPGILDRRNNSLIKMKQAIDQGEVFEASKEDFNSLVKELISAMADDIIENYDANFEEWVEYGYDSPNAEVEELIEKIGAIDEKKWMRIQGSTLLGLVKQEFKSRKMKEVNNGSIIELTRQPKGPTVGSLIKMLQKFKPEMALTFSAEIEAGRGARYADPAEFRVSSEEGKVHIHVWGDETDSD